MLRIEYEGAQSLLDFLKNPDTPVNRTGVMQVLDANQFFVNYYCQWNGINDENLAEALTCLNQSNWQTASPVLQALMQGFREATSDIDTLQRKLNFLKGVDPTGLTYRALAHLPEGTPLNSVIHLTIDSFNGGFQYLGEIGLSLLQDITNPDSFGPIVAHELHHAGYRYWADKDPIRQVVLNEDSGRSIAVQHVDNLLAEGLANYYCSPIKIDREKMDAILISRLEQFQRDDRLMLSQAVKVLALAFTPGVNLTDCEKAYHALAIDPQGIQPAGHYIGARMVEIMSQVHSHEAIIGCVRFLPDFLLLYNQAAEQTGMPIFDPLDVDQFYRIWHPG